MERRRLRTAMNRLRDNSYFLAEKLGEEDKRRILFCTGRRSWYRGGSQSMLIAPPGQKIVIAVAARRRRCRRLPAATVEKLHRRAERPLDRVLVERARRSSHDRAARRRPLGVSPLPVSSSSLAHTAPSSSVPTLASGQ